MTGITLFFVIVGVGAASVNLMKLVTWLDTPRYSAHRAPRGTAAASGAVEFPCAELGLERARHAA